LKQLDEFCVCLLYSLEWEQTVGPQCRS